MNGDTSAVARGIAAAAAAAAIQTFGRQTVLAEDNRFLFRRLVYFLAVTADLADQPLGDYANQ
ncbi:hypothetical protein D3C86_2268210 [compost metagenome]